jgi:hypothetical protein
MEKLPIYDIVINETDETGLQFNSFVDRPAHQKDFIMFDKETDLFFDEESKTVVGVMVAADDLIYRNSLGVGEHYVKFSKDQIKNIVIKMSKQGAFNNVNEDHANEVNGISLIGFYQTEKKIGLEAPSVLRNNQQINDGSLIGIYLVENKEMISKIKKGEINGFSIEGIFEKVKLKIENNMKNPFEKFKKKKEVFAQAVADDGTKLTWEGDLTIDETIISVIGEDGETTPAPAKDWLVVTEDGTQFIVTTDETGLVKAVEEVAAEEAPTEEAPKEDEAMAKILKENTELKAQLSKFNKQFEKPATAKDKIDFFALAQKIKKS